MGKKSRNPKKKEKKDNADKKQKSKQGSPILLEDELLEKANDTSTDPKIPPLTMEEEEQLPELIL